MTEQAKPKGTPYSLAVALLHEFQECLPSAVVVLPDYVLWPHPVEALSADTFQVLDEAAAVLGALHAQHIPLALLVPSSCSSVLKACLAETQLLAQFAAVVEYQKGEPLAQQEQQQQQAASDSWMAAATAVKAATGVPWQQTLLFCPDAAVDAVRLANKLGMAVARVPAVSGLNVECLQRGLEAYSSKLESDRGY